MPTTLSTGCPEGPDARGGSADDVVLVTPCTAALYGGGMSTPGSDARTATNQAPALVGHNVVTSDLALTEALARHGSAALVEELTPLGAEAGTEEAREHGMLANRHHPELATYDRWGNRVGIPMREQFPRFTRLMDAVRARPAVARVKTSRSTEEPHERRTDLSLRR